MSLYISIFILAVISAYINYHLTVKRLPKKQKNLSGIVKGQFWIAFLYLLITLAISYSQKESRDEAAKQEIDRSKEMLSTIEDLQAGQYLNGKFDFDFGTPLFDTSKVILVFGGNTFGTTLSNAGAIIAFKSGFQPIRFILKDQKLTVSLKVFGLDGYPLVEVDSNSWKRNANSSYKFNFDKRGFEIFDDSNNIALNINLTSRNVIEIKGYFIDKMNNVIMRAGNFLRIADYNTDIPMVMLDKFVKQDPPDRLFEYSGEHPLHKRSGIIPKITLDNH